MSLRNIILVVKDVSKSRKFYEEIIGLPLRFASEEMAEFDLGKTSLLIKGTYNAAHVQTGYSPILSFDIQNMETIVTNALAVGAMMDGPIKYPAQGKFAALRSPDGHMLGLFEPAIKANSETN